MEMRVVLALLLCLLALNQVHAIHKNGRPIQRMLVRSAPVVYEVLEAPVPSLVEEDMSDSLTAAEREEDAVWETPEMVADSSESGSQEAASAEHADAGHEQEAPHADGGDADKLAVTVSENEQLKARLAAEEARLKADEAALDQHKAGEAQAAEDQKMEKLFQQTAAEVNQAASQTIATAQQEAQQLLQQAAAGGPAAGAKGGCFNKKTACDDPSFGQPPPGPDMEMLLPQKAVARIDDANLGLTDRMSVSQRDLDSAARVVHDAQLDHEAFVNKHEEDCKGAICPFSRNTVMANVLA